MTAAELLRFPQRSQETQVNGADKVISGGEGTCVSGSQHSCLIILSTRRRDWSDMNPGKFCGIALAKRSCVAPFVPTLAPDTPMNHHIKHKST